MSERARDVNMQEINQADVLQLREQARLARQHSYELTQKLTYFVISIQLVFCGYMLLNAAQLSGMKGANFLFLACGIAALFGLLWRFVYNQTYHDNVHGTRGKFHGRLTTVQSILYWIYVILSVSVFVWALIAGFFYLSNFL